MAKGHTIQTLADAELDLARALELLKLGNSKPAIGYVQAAQAQIKRLMITLRSVMD